MIAGRKLLLADDSPAVQKVVDLTFSDEGMQVTTVGDGEQALAKLEQVAPDIVLADVFMPGVGGYELCRFIKQSERFRKIPVMLLVGYFEPFDEAEARRAGADAVVTKPFQSIRQLIGRVGSLLDRPSAEEEATHEYSTLGLGRIDARAPTVTESETASKTNVGDTATEANVKVFVEAPVMTDLASHDVSAETCPVDIEAQTADTKEFNRVEAEPISSTVEPATVSQDDTIETEPIADTKASVESYTEVQATKVQAGTEAPAIVTREVDDRLTRPIAAQEPADAFSDALLDLGDFGNSAQAAIEEDVVLDLDYEAGVGGPGATTLESIPEPAPDVEIVSPVEVIAAEPAQEVEPVAIVEGRGWAIATETVAEETPPVSVIEEEQPAAKAHDLQSLSPETIDAIARRVVEQMSEKVVREIAWEVVPELAELLIKQKLDEQK